MSLDDSDYHVTFAFTPAFAAVAGRGLVEAAQKVSAMSETELHRVFDEVQGEEAELGRALDAFDEAKTNNEGQ